MTSSVTLILLDRSQAIRKRRREMGRAGKFGHELILALEGVSVGWMMLRAMREGQY